MKPTDQKGTARKNAGKKKGAKEEPEPEPFYEEIPVKVTVLGNFQNIVHFFEKVSKLPRIVNVSGIVMGDRKEIKGRGYLITSSCMVKTYMFIDKEKTSEKQNEKK
jgi:type IV pilus assembly protein PilO